MARHNLLRTFGPSRRAFLRACGALAASTVLPASAAEPKAMLALYNAAKRERG